MNKSKLVCTILTLIMTVTLCFGGGAMLAVAETSQSVQNAATEGEQTSTSQTAENVAGWTKTSTSAGAYYYKNYAYTGGVQSVVLPKGTYKLEAWGAQGGNDSSGVGGHGGYAAGTLTVTADTTIYIVVGGVGKNGAGAATRGYNGGGSAGTYGTSGGGGGATHFAKATGVLNALKNNKGSVLVVGGGGGGGGSGGTPCGGWGGLTPGANAAGNTYINNNDSYFGQGQDCINPGTNVDGGGGGGGYYGGYGSTTDSQGAGGLSFVATSLASRTFYNGNVAMPNPTSYGANYTKGTGNSGLNGYARIVCTNLPPTAKSGVSYTINRTAKTNITASSLVNDACPYLESGHVFINNAIYTNSACTTAATSYLEYSLVSGTTNTLAVRAKKVFASTTFYANVRDAAGTSVVTSFTINGSGFGAITKLGNGSKGGGTGIYGNSVKTSTNYPLLSAVSSSASWGASEIYNDAGTGRLTYMITKPLELNAYSRGGYTSVTITASELARGSDQYPAGTYLDTVFFTTFTLSGSGTYYNISYSGGNANASKAASFTISPLLANRAGWFRIPVTIGLFENSTNTELTSASSGRLAVDIVFRIGNERPTQNAATLVDLNTTGKLTQKVTLSQLVTDRNGNDLSFFAGSNLTDVVKVPQYEYFGVNKFGTAYTATSVTTNYNVGSAKSDVVTSAESGTATGFSQNSIFNASMSSSVYNEAFVSYTLDSTGITFTAIRATRSQYSASRAKAGLGDFYVLVHITDSGDTRDTGIWYPIAIRVTDTSAPTVRSLSYELDAPTEGEGGVTAAGESAVIAPYYVATDPSVGIGALSAADYNTPANYVENALGIDSSEFALSTSSFFFNDFLHINTDFGSTLSSSDYATDNADSIGFTRYIKAEKVPLYAPANRFSRLTAAQKTAAEITVNGDVATFYGIKLTAIRSTLDLWLDVPVRLTDTFGNSASAVIAVKVNNRAPQVRDNMYLQNIAERTEETVTQPDGSSEKVVTVTYSVPNNLRNMFRITPYDLVYDADLASQPTINNTSTGAANNSNPANSGNAALSDAIYSTPNRVRSRTDLSTLGAAGTAGVLGGDTLSFVTSSLPFNYDGSSYTQSRYIGELSMAYVPSSASASGGTMDCFQITPLLRNNGDNAYTFDNVQVTDSSGATVTFNIYVRVVNTKPTLKSDIPDVFYLSANYDGSYSFPNSSNPDKGGESVGSDYETTWSPDTGYNVREFALREIVTDADTADLSSLAIMQQPQLGYMSGGVFTEVADYSQYVTVDYNVIGSGTRSNYSVIRITGKSSTQSLQHGLFVQFKVTDGFNNSTEFSYLQIQVEVLNSNPVFVGSTQFEKNEKDPDDSVNYWFSQPSNNADILAPRYIAPDSFTTELLTNVGIVGLDSKNPSQAAKVTANKVKFFALDYDALQHIMPDNDAANMLPVASLKTPAVGGGYFDKTTPATAVTFTNPYSEYTNESAEVENTVKIVWFINSAGSYHLVDPSDPADLNKYSTTLQECLEKDSLRWAIKITPAASFGTSGLEITVRYRDSSPDGGCTTSLNLPVYVGKRPNTTTLNSRASATFNYSIGSLGITKNLVAFADPNNEANDNRYSYSDGTDNRYPAGDPFYYDSVELENNANTGADTPAYIPVSYLAVPQEIAHSMTYTVDFAFSRYLRDEHGIVNPANPTDLTKNMWASMTLLDPVTGLSWTGDEIANNPYVNIEYTEDFSAISADKYLNTPLYFWNDGEENRSSDAALREDLFGFKLTKKSVRSKGRLELNVSLAKYQYDSGSNNTTVSGAKGQRSVNADTSKVDPIETVTLYIEVPNDNMQLSNSVMELSTAALNKANPSSGSNAAEFTIGSQNAIISLVGDDAAKNALSRTNYRLFAEYDYDSSLPRDYLTAPYKSPITGSVTTRTYKERAYFLNQSVTGLSQDYIDRLLDGTSGNRTYGKNVTDAQLAAYFGIKEKDASGNAVNLADELNKIRDGSRQAVINPGYTNFFTVSPMGRDDANLSFRAVRRISLDAETVFDKMNGGVEPSADDMLSVYERYIASEEQLKGLAVKMVNNSVVVYYPFRVVVYDDYEGSGFFEGSYQMLEIDVYIGNSNPYANKAMISTDSADGRYYYNLDIAKGDSYMMRISDFFGDNDMRLNNVYAYKTREELEKSGNSVIDINTSDYYVAPPAGTTGNVFSTLRLTAATDVENVAIEFNGKYDVPAKQNVEDAAKTGYYYDNAMIGSIRFTAVNRAKNVSKFTLTFSDNARVSVSIEFRITISNQAPVALIADGGQTYVKTSDIKMRTGEVFTMLATSWDKFIGGMYAITGVSPNAEFGDDFYTKGYVDNGRTVELNQAQKTEITNKYAIGRFSDYEQFSNRNRKSNSYTEAYARFDFSDVGLESKLKDRRTEFIFDSTKVSGTYAYEDGRGNHYASGNLGYLALADDDLPWGLKFRITDSVIGVATDAISAMPLNTLGDSYAVAYQFKANSGCNNVPITLRAYDAEGKSIQFTFRITVENSDPELVGENVESEKYGGIRFETGEYRLTMTYGQVLEIPVSALAFDNDLNDRYNLRTQRAYNGSAFEIDGFGGISSNDYISAEDGLSRITLRCTGVLLGDKTDTVVRFRVVDPLATKPLQITIRISTKYSPLTDAANTNNFEVKSVEEYYDALDNNPSVLNLVGGSAATDKVKDGDFGAPVRYGVQVYALFDILGSGALRTVTPANATGVNSEAYELLNYSTDTGKSTETVNETALKKFEFIRKYFDFDIASDDASVSFVPTGMRISGALPLYFKVTKTVGAGNYDESVNRVGGVTVNVTVKNSAPYSIGETATNSGSFANDSLAVKPSANYLTVRGCAGYAQEYRLWNRDDNDRGLFADYDDEDELSFVDYEVVGSDDGAGNVVMPADGWQEDKTAGLPQAFNIIVSNGSLRAIIVRKVVNPDGADKAFVIPVKVTVKDKTGATTSTVITFEIHNSAPTFTEFNLSGSEGYDRNKYSVTDAGEEYLLEMAVRFGETKQIDLSEFLSDDDMAGGEKFALAEYTKDSRLSLHDLDYANNAGMGNVHYAGTSAEARMFAVRLASENNLKFSVEGLSSNRGLTADVIVILQDSSLVQTEKLLRIRLVVGNSAPVRVKEESTITLMGSDDLSVVASSQVEISIADWFEDPNPADNGGEQYPDSKTYMRIYAYQLGDIYSYGDTVEGDDPNTDNDPNLFVATYPTDNNAHLQKLRIMPRANRYGSQQLVIYVTDDGATGAADAYSLILELTVIVARDLNSLELIDRTVPWMREDEITVEKIIPKAFALGYNITNIRQDVEVANYERGAVNIRYDEENGTYWVKAMKRPGSSGFRVGMIATLVAGNTAPKDLMFDLTILPNDAPRYITANGAEVKEYGYETDVLSDERSISIKAEDWFIDPEEDNMTLLDVKSSHSFVVTAELNKESNEIVLKFKARGSSSVDVTLTDATGQEYGYTVTVTNTTLPELNFFLGVIQSMVLHPWSYIGVVALVILLLLLIIFLVGLRRKKQRERAEVEALLVSEMQLEEQMLRIAQAQQRQAEMNCNNMLPPYSQGYMQGGIGLPPPVQGTPPAALGAPPEQNGINQLPPGGNGGGYDGNGF